MPKEKKKKIIATQKSGTIKEKKQSKVLDKLGFVQMVFDFYTMPVE